MTKYSYYFLLLFFLFQVFNASTQVVYNYQCIKSTTEEIAKYEIKNIYKYSDKFEKTTKNAKILVLPFYSNENEFTEMSISIAMDLTDALQARSQDKKKKLVFFYPEEYAKKGNSIVAETNLTSDKTSEYWESLITRFNPDFFIEGYYFIDAKDDGSYTLTLKNINLKPNDMVSSDGLSKLTITSVVTPINDQDLIKSLQTSEIYYLNSSELIFEQKKQIINNKIKTSLTNSGYTVETTKDKSNFEVKITGAAREFNNANGIYISYVDVNLNVIDLKTNKSVYENNYTEKGGSVLSYADAAEKSYESVSKQILNDLTIFISKK